MTHKYLNRLVTAYPCIKEIWLIGSRANSSHRPDSDWDYLVWSDDDQLFDMLSQDVSFHDPSVDLLIVRDELFAKPWLEPDGSRKKGEDLYGPYGLRWRRTSGTETETYYTEAKEAEPGSSCVRTQVVKALLRYRRGK